MVTKAAPAGAAFPVYCCVLCGILAYFGIVGYAVEVIVSGDKAQIFMHTVCGGGHTVLLCVEQKSVGAFTYFGVVGHAVEEIFYGDQAQIHAFGFRRNGSAVRTGIGAGIGFVPAVHQQAVFQL